MTGARGSKRGFLRCGLHPLPSLFRLRDSAVREVFAHGRAGLEQFGWRRGLLVVLLGGRLMPVVLGVIGALVPALALVLSLWSPIREGQKQGQGQRGRITSWGCLTCLNLN